MRAAKKTFEEQYQLILECRKSGLTDCDWCRKNGINLKTFRNWIGKFKKKAGYPVPDSSKRTLSINQSVQKIAKIEILPEGGLSGPAENNNGFQPSSSIEIITAGATFRFSGTVDVSLYEKTLLMLGGSL